MTDGSDMLRRDSVTKLAFRWHAHSEGRAGRGLTAHSVRSGLSQRALDRNAQLGGVTNLGSKCYRVIKMQRRTQSFLDDTARRSGNVRFRQGRGAY